MGMIERKCEIIVDNLISRYPILEELREDIINGYIVLEECYKRGGKVLIAGNGGSAADAEHIVGELMKGFVKKREVSQEFREQLKAIDMENGDMLADKLQGGLPAIALSGHVALSTAFLNDVDGLLCFAQQVNGYGTREDVLIGLSTSGNSKNVLYACTVAKAKGMKVIGLTGKDGGKLKEISDVAIVAPSEETYIIQELHLPIYHAICLMLEEKFF